MMKIRARAAAERAPHRWQKRRTRARVLVALLAAALLAGCGRERGPQRILLVVLDAARPDRLEKEGLTPELDRLAQGGVVFTQHFAQDTATLTSIPKLLFSRYFAPLLFPNSAQVPFFYPSELFREFDRESISLPRALAGEGYYTALISAHSWFRPGTKLEAEFDELIDLSSTLDFDPRYSYPRAEQVIDFAISWLGEHKEEKLFVYLHLMDSHFPHYFEEDAQALLEPAIYDEVNLELFNDTGRPKSLLLELSGPERRYLDALYDGSLRYADRHLGRLFDSLRAESELDDTLIVVTSDHGEHLLEEPGRFGHGGPWYDAVARVPLIVSYPKRLVPDRCDHLTESVDVMPTILELAGVGLSPGKKLDGRDLVALLQGEAEARTHVFGAFAVRSPRHKAIWPGGAAVGLGVAEIGDLGSTAGPHSPELYELDRDPLESENVWSSRAELGGELREIYRETMEPFYRRHQEARRSDPPDGAFAIAASHFECEPTATVIGEAPGEGAIEVPDAAAGWLQSRHWNRFFLLAVGDTAPIEIGFPLPSAAYRVFFSLRGTCEVQLPGAVPSALVGEPLATERVGDWVVRTETLEHGVVEILGDRFTARLRSPAAAAPCFLRYIGFGPPDRNQEPEDWKSQQDYEKRLEALGYIN